MLSYTALTNTTMTEKDRQINISLPFYQIWLIQHGERR